MKFHLKMHPRLTLLTLACIINLNLTYTVLMYAGELIFPSDEKYDWWNIIVWISAPVFVTYLSYIIAFTGYFWINLRYIHLKQIYFINVFKKMIIKLQRNHKQTEIIKKYFKKIVNILELMKEIRAYNQFWSKYSTVTLLLFSMEVCYIGFAWVSAKTFSERMRLAPLTLFGSVYLLYIQVISSQCSRVIVNNNEIYKNIQRFNFDSKKYSLRILFKIENIGGFQNILRRTSFRLLNGTIINNKLFEALGSWIIVVSLKLFGRQLASQIQAY